MAQMLPVLFDSRQTFPIGDGRTGTFYSVPQLEQKGVGKVARLPVCIRIVLESLLRNHDGKKIKEEDVRGLARWEPKAERTAEIPFVVARIVLQDFTGVPLLVDLAAMRSAVQRLGKDPARVEPLVPVALVIDHSVQVDYWGSTDALRQNMETEFRRNRERYEFLKWGMQAFNGLTVVPPGVGIVHQVNLEYLAQAVIVKDGVWYPDTLVGTDSHTTMINGLGIVGWGVGGIEAEAGMLGQPVYLLTPDVVGVHLAGKLRDGVTATDLTLRVTEMLRAAKVVGKFVEFHGEGAASLSLPDRATIANMAPEYGATMGFFPFDEESCRYLLGTGRPKEHVDAVRAYFEVQGLFGIPKKGQCDYSQVLELDLDQVRPSVAGPKRPQDRIELPNLKARFEEALTKPVKEGGYGKNADELGRRFETAMLVDGVKLPPQAAAGGGKQELRTPAKPGEKQTNPWTEIEMVNNRPTPEAVVEPVGYPPELTVDIGHGDVVIAAITSCTNTSNPSVMLAAGLVAKKAVARGMRLPQFVKASLAPGSRVVSDYLERTGLQSSLDALGFNLVGYGCTTCIGNSGPLDPRIEEVIVKNDLAAASVLSGNRNFEARVHQSVKANFLMSPPLVVAFALAGTVHIDLAKESLGKDSAGHDVFLRDLWPTPEELRSVHAHAMDPAAYLRLYGEIADPNPLWSSIEGGTGKVYEWKDSTYIQEPPFFEFAGKSPHPVHDKHSARALAIFGDSVTTDHISPAGSIKPSSPAGLYLQEKGVAPADFNSYGARRGNDRVMTRGTFANVRIKNLMVPGVEGGVTVHQPSGERLSIYDAALRYHKEGVSLVVLAGHEYGSGSSRDWAAKGTLLLGVRAVIAQSFERIHRNNLVGMGVLPCQFPEGVGPVSLGLDGTELFDIIGLERGIRPMMELSLEIRRTNGVSDRVPVVARIDTPIETDYYQHGGILPYVLRQIVA